MAVLLNFGRVGAGRSADLHGAVPAAADQQVRLSGVELDGEHAVRVARRRLAVPAPTSTAVREAGGQWQLGKVAPSEQRAQLARHAGQDQPKLLARTFGRSHPGDVRINEIGQHRTGLARTSKSAAAWTRDGAARHTKPSLVAGGPPPYSPVREGVQQRAGGLAVDAHCAVQPRGRKQLAVCAVRHAQHLVARFAQAAQARARRGVPVAQLAVGVCTASEARE